MSGMSMEVGNSMDGMKDMFYRKVKGVVYDLQTGSIALKNADGSVSILDRTEGIEGREGVEPKPPTNTLKNVPFNVTMAMPAFAMHTDIKKVKVGDLVVSDRGVIGFVIDVGSVEVITNTVFVMLRPNGEMVSTAVPTNSLLGKEGIMVVQSMNLSKEGSEDGGMNPMMMAMMGKGDIDPMMMMAMMGKGDIDPMMMMMAMMGKGDIDPMMMMAMMGKGDIDPMMMAMMMGKNNKTVNVWNAK